MIRDVTVQDYPMLIEWWNSHGFEIPPIGTLPATGYIANDAAAGFLYLTNSQLACMGWCVVNPKADRQLRSSSLDEVVQKIEFSALFSGATSMWSFTNVFPFAERLRRLGWAEGDKRATHFVKSLR